MRTLSKLLQEKRETAMEKLHLDQKKFVLDVVTNDLGLPKGQMWPFMYSDDEGDDKDAYEDLAEAEEDLALFEEVVDKKKKKRLVEAVNDFD